MCYVGYKYCKVQIVFGDLEIYIVHSACIRHFLSFTIFAWHDSFVWFTLLRHSHDDDDDDNGCMWMCKLHESMCVV